MLLGLAVVSEAFRLKTKTFTISAAFLSLVLAMILLGPAPAVLVGVVGMAVDALRRRAPWRHALANLSTYAAFPLAGSVAFDALGGHGLAGDMPLSLRAGGLRAVHGDEPPQLRADRASTSRSSTASR